MPKPRPKSPISVPTEHAEQAALITWANMSTGKHPELRLLFAIPNGSFLGDGVKRLASGKTVSLGAIRSRKLKAEGVKPGVPDLCLPVARGGYFGLYIEMKRFTGGALSPEQKQWRQDLIEQGYHVELCKGQPAAQSSLTTYLTLPATQLTKASQAHKTSHELLQPTKSTSPTKKPASLSPHALQPVLECSPECERLVRHCVEGTVVFKRNKSAQCACCEGNHIYLRFLRLDDYGGWSNNEQERDADHFIREKVLFAENVENARLRITVEILPNDQTVATEGAGESPRVAKPLKQD